MWNFYRKSSGLLDWAFSFIIWKLESRTHTRCGDSNDRDQLKNFSNSTELKIISAEACITFFSHNSGQSRLSVKNNLSQNFTARQHRLTRRAIDNSFSKNFNWYNLDKAIHTTLLVYRKSSVLDWIFLYRFKIYRAAPAHEAGGDR